MGSPGHSVMHQAILVSSSRQRSNYCVCLLHGDHGVQNPPHTRKHRPTLPNSDSSSLVSRIFSRLSPRSWVSGPAHHGHCVCVMKSPQKFLRALIPGHLFHGTPALPRYDAVLCCIQTISTLSGLSPAMASLTFLWFTARGSSASGMCAQPCPTLCDLMDCSPPGSSVHRVFQTRILEWVAIFFPKGSSWSRDQTVVSCIGGWILHHWAAREAHAFGTQPKSPH